MDDIRSGLIVEDHADARAWLARALCQGFPGIDVVQTETLAEARAELSRFTPDIAIIDLGLPDGSGLDLIHELNHAEQPTIVIVSTIYEDDSHVFTALRAGAQGYILKDETQASLVSMLEGIVQGRPPLSPTIAHRLLSHFHVAEQPETDKLTERERDVLTLLSKGYSVKKVASLLDISANTAAGYVKAIYRKLNISTRAEAAIEASKRGLIDNSNY